MVKRYDSNALYKAIKYRIYPTLEQETQIAQTFGCTRLVYNELLSLEMGLHEAEMGFMNQFELINYTNKVLKDCYPFLREIDKFALDCTCKNLVEAYTNFFEGRTKFPKFKSKKDTYKSYTTNYTNNNIEVGIKQVKLPKLGKVEASIHRTPFKGATIKCATISKDSRNKYYVSIMFKLKETKEEINQTKPTLDKTLGIDYSSPHFYVDSNNKSVDAPHWYRQREKRLAKEQKRLSRMIKNSKNYEKQKLRVSNLHEEISNQRRDFCHKLSREIANLYDVVCVEDINLQHLSQSLRFGKATHDNGFGLFRNYLKYKLEEQGKYYVVIDKWFPSSKTCSCCGTVNKDLKLGQQTWTCPNCNTTHSRDYNAAINIKNEGFRVLTTMLKPAEVTE